MDILLKLLRNDASLKPAQIAAMLNLTEAEVAAKVRALEADGTILGYRTVLNEEKVGGDVVRAVIEVKLTPERGGGFDRLAERMRTAWDGVLATSQKHGVSLREAATVTAVKRVKEAHEIRGLYP